MNYLGAFYVMLFGAVTRHIERRRSLTSIVRQMRRNGTATLGFDVDEYIVIIRSSADMQRNANDPLAPRENDI